MKSSFIFILLLNIAFINSDVLSSKYLASFLLSNYDIFLVFENGTTVYDYKLSNFKYSHDFSSSQILRSDNGDAGSIAFSQFPKGNDNNNIVISLIKDILYFFTSEGKYLFETNITEYYNLGIYNNLIAYKYDYPFYYYIIYYINDASICIRYFQLSKTSQENKQLSYIEYKPSIEYDISYYYCLSCEIMITSENKEVILCFHQLNFPYKIRVTSFNFSNTFINAIDLNFTYKSNNYNNAYVIKSATSEDKQKALICYISFNGNGTCLSYNIITNEFSEEQVFYDKCDFSATYMHTYYFKDKNEYMFTCNSFLKKNEYKIVTFNENFIPSVKGENSLTEGNYKFAGICYPSKTFSIVYIKGINNYGIINDCLRDFDNYFSGIVPLSDLFNESNIFSDENEEKSDESGEESDVLSLVTTNVIMEEDIITTTDIITEMSQEITNIPSVSNINETIIYPSQETYFGITDEISNSLISEIPNSNILSDIITNKLTGYISEIESEKSIIETDIQTNLNTNIITNKIIENKTDLITVVGSEIEDKKTEEKIIDKNITSFIKEIITKKKEEILKELNNLIKIIDINESHLIKGEDFSIIIKPINEYIEESTINIDFSECEKILKEKYPSSNFIFLQINMKNSNQNCLTEQVEYEVYNDQKELVDLSLCKDVEISIEYEIANYSSLNLDDISSFKDIGVDVFNIYDDFFNDICYSYSDSNTNSDMILKDRVSDIYQNYSLCGSECEYDSFNLEKMSANCICKVKQEVNTKLEQGNFKTYIKSAFLESNFGVIKCYNLVFSLKGKLYNYGFWIFGIMILLHIPIYILYCINGINPVKNYIIKEMFNKGYEPNKNIINHNNQILNHAQETTNIKKRNNKIKNVNKLKRNSFVIIKHENANPPKKRITFENVPTEDEKDNNIKKRNKKLKIMKQNSEKVKNNFIFKNSDIYEDNSDINDNENINRRKSMKKVIKIDEISENSHNISNSSIKNTKLEDNIYKGKQRNRKSVKLPYKTFDIFNKIKNNNENKENTETINIERNKKGKKNNLNRKRFTTVLKADGVLIDSESGYPLNRNSKLFNNQNNVFQKESNNKLNRRRYKSTILTNNQLSTIHSYKIENEQMKKDKNKEYPLIRIKADNEKEYFPLKSNYILDNYDYNEAIEYDKRLYFRIFFIYLISKDNLLNIIFFNPPLELKPLRFSIFIFSYACDMAFNALFYLSDNISDKYNYEGENVLLFSIFNNIIISAISTLVSYFLILFFQSLTRSSEKIEKIFRDEEDLLKNDKNYKVEEIKKLKIENEVLKILKCLKIKIIYYIISEFIFMLFFFYYVTAFCAVYNSTQISWLLDCVSSYVLSLIITLSVSIIFSLFYKLSIRYEMKVLYKICIFVYSFG